MGKGTSASGGERAYKGRLWKDRNAVPKPLSHSECEIGVAQKPRFRPQDEDGLDCLDQPRR